MMMHRFIKYRYLLYFRLDSHYVLKLLIIFNLFLGIYLLFLSTNYRKYNTYPINTSDFDSHPKELNGDGVKDIKSNVIPTNPSQVVALSSINKVSRLKIRLPSGGQAVEKVYDSNNKLVVQEVDNAADSSFKHVEEDEKTIDENDKLRIDMFGSQNSIIHDEEFSKIDSSNNNKVDGKKLSSNVIKDGTDINKDVINQILDHNLHLKKNKTKLIVPEANNFENNNNQWTSEIRGKYTVYKDYISANVPLSLMGKTITLTTQGTHEFLHHSIELCDRWEGYISLAVYAPGDDFKLAVNMIYYMRQCTKRCVADRIHWHLVFETVYSPLNASAATFFLETQNFDCSITLEETIRLFNLESNFRETKSLPYPINVLRNVARINSKTKYIFASDIELYPSVGIVPAFFKLLQREKLGQVSLINQRNPHVYVTPIFEVKETVKPPRTKNELIELFNKKDAIFFHRFVCDFCQNFPDRDKWVKQYTQNNTLDVFRVTRRNRIRNQWEPLYIGTNSEPFYDERLTWDGKRDKMSQMYEMCLLNYDLLILDNAFLVHAPGIKYYHPKDDAKRLVFMRENQKIYNQLMAQLRQKYGVKNDC